MGIELPPFVTVSYVLVEVVFFPLFLTFFFSSQLNWHMEREVGATENNLLRSFHNEICLLECRIPTERANNPAHKKLRFAI